ncbi:hypothetical protein CAOG_00370 [Capsaspora owczarzaki ATCC 30864]|uniref:Uncharacterized protein n=1 Tax=Capsaspora owczarzaki (strain ATCC 30864) TaxID=595528 RepID=A0A0D2VG37_CAPO3|nr:hypothetical protein CAOG_00370 [Capsaspora owczarzaki ATCC 30864]KJE88782.1 hypothetical protein CAOG_000370 [Capsaspora owczarzaki ATCC 30864]|eukprot:XP_004365241.1 hypothetical protein CAOG_00370 [Capsaspora owczarzaki ATCC 30864]
MDEPWLLDDRAKREVQHRLLSCFDGLASPFGHRRVDALRRLLSYLGSLASGESSHEKASFLSLQVHEGEFNVIFRALSALTSPNHIPPDFISAEEYVRTFQVVEGLCLLHVDAPRQFCDLGGLELLIAVTEQCVQVATSSSREVFTNALDLLASTLAQGPAYVDNFRELEGFSVLVSLVNRKSLDNAMRATVVSTLALLCASNKPLLAQTVRQRLGDLMGTETIDRMLTLTKCDWEAGKEPSIEAAQKFLTTID